MKKLFIALFAIFICSIGFLCLKAEAAQIDISVGTSDGSSGGAILDNDYMTTETFEGGTVLTISASEPIDSIYIKWDSIPAPWTMDDGGNQIPCGQNGFLHEFVQLSGAFNMASITIPSGGAKIADLYAFSAGELPDFVEKWEPSWDKADILFISTHSDDEVLFFGGMIPIYTNEQRARVQVAYFTDFFLTESYRNHELLDGIWTMGVNHYPQLGRFYDNYSESLEQAEAQFDHADCFSYIMETIRRFKPQVVVTHDVNGEYGHGGHQYVSSLVREAVELTNDPNSDPGSAAMYGTWDVPKTYLHLYPDNPIQTDTRAPLSSFGGRNALQVAKDAYLKHGSQQWMWFYVDDGYDEAGNPNGYQYSCGQYGLYRTLVGLDTGNDVLEHLTPYMQQTVETSTDNPEDQETEPAPDSEQEQKKSGSGLLVVIIIIVLLIILVIIILLVMKKRQERKRAEMLRRARAKRAAEARRRREEMSAYGNRTTGTYRTSREEYRGGNSGTRSSRSYSGSRQDGYSANRQAGYTGSRSGSNNSTRSTRPEESRTGRSAGSRSGGYYDTRPARYSESRPGSYNGNRPIRPSDARPGESAGSRSGGYNGNRPTRPSDSRSGSFSGSRQGRTSDTRSGSSSGGRRNRYE